LRPPVPTGGLFVALRRGISKSLGFTAIRAMLRGGTDPKLLEIRFNFSKGTEFSRFFCVNELIYL
jgi:hypothetical protein